MLLRIVLASCFILLFGAASSAYGSQSDLAEQLRRIPSGLVGLGPSLAVGGTSGGHLEGGMKLDMNFPHLRVLKRTRYRGLFWGHSRLVRALERVATNLVEGYWPPSPVWTGNLTKAGGGKIGPSRSHQTGLDADLVIPVLSDGQESSPAIRPIRAPGEPVDDRPLMDVSRTWALVEAILNEPEIDVLWIFLSDPLIDAVIEYAVLNEAPDELVVRALHVLHQPSDSLPHDDHLHLRIGCRASDFLVGCRNSRPPWPWLNDGRQGAYNLVMERFLDALNNGVALDSALRAVIRVRHIKALPYAFVLMGDSRPRIRKLAATAVALLHPAHLILAGLSGVLTKRELLDVETRTLSRSSGALSGLRAAQLLEEMRGCRKGGKKEIQRLFKVLIRDPDDGAIDAITECYHHLKPSLKGKALDVLVRIAGRPAPRGSEKVVAKSLVEAVQRFPGDRLWRLWDGYFGAGSDVEQSETKLEKRVFGKGVNAMNIRELLERIRGEPRRSNLMPRSRLVRVWKNRLKVSARQEAMQRAPGRGQ